MPEITPRPMNAFGVQPLVMDSAGEAEVFDERVIENRPDSGAGPEDAASDGLMTPEQYQRAQRDALGAEWDELEKLVVGHVMRGKDEMWRARNSADLQIDDRYQIEEHRFRCGEGPIIGTDGQPIKGSMNAHLKAGVTLGLFTDNVTVVGPMITEGALGAAGDPFSLEPLGRKTENDSKRLLFSEALKQQIDQSSWREEISSGLNDLPKHGTAIWRQSWCDEVEIIQSAPGRFEERVRRRGMTIKHWNLLDCYVSHPERRNAEDQETVIWHSRTTVAGLARNERMPKADVKIALGEQGEVIFNVIEAERGHFVGLEKLRRLEAERYTQGFETRQVGESTRGQSAGTGANAETQDSYGIVSPAMQVDKYESQGAFPAAALIRAGKLTPRALAYTGVSILDSQGKPVDGEALARLAERLCWYVTVAVADSGGHTGSLLAIRPSPYRRSRTELLAATFIRDGQKFYGLSSDAIGNDVSSTADKAMNDIADILDNNADPPLAYASDAFDDDEQAESWMGNPGDRIAIKGAKTPKDALAFFERPFDEHMLMFLELLVQTYTIRTMATRGQAGGESQTQSKTYSEGRDQLQAAERRLFAIIKRVAELQIVVPSIQRCLEDLCWFLDPDDLRDYADRVAGEYAIDIETILPSGREDGTLDMTSVADDFIVKHPGNASIPKEVAVQFLMVAAEAEQKIGNIPAGERMRQMAFRLQGIDPDPFYSDQKRPLSPRVELRLIVGGDSPKPNPNEDALMHYQSHLIQLQFIQYKLEEVAAAGEDTKFLEGAIKVLGEHTVATKELMAQQQMEMIQAMMAAQTEAQPGQNGSKGKNENGAKGATGKSGPPPEAQRILAGLRTSAGANHGNQRG